MGVGVWREGSWEGGGAQWLKGNFEELFFLCLCGGDRSSVCLHCWPVYVCVCASVRGQKQHLCPRLCTVRLHG